MELMCPGVPVTACASMRPSASNTPAARSPDSRTMVEKAVRCRVCACSSTTAIRRLHMICLSIRPSVFGLSIFKLLRRLRRAGPLGPQPINLPCRCCRDQFLSQVVLNQGTVTRQGVADAATAGRHDQNAFADRDEVPALAGQPVPRFQADIAGAAVEPPCKSAGGKFDPLE